MPNDKILINLQRCTGCWTCAMACKTINHLDDDEFRITVRTLGSGEGIDHPSGTWPNLHVSWEPVIKPTCTKCAGRTAKGELPFCVYNCTNRAMKYGEDADAEIERLQTKGFETFELPAYEDSKANVVYAYK